MFAEILPRLDAGSRPLRRFQEGVTGFLARYAQLNRDQGTIAGVIDLLVAGRNLRRKLNGLPGPGAPKYRKDDKPDDGKKKRFTGANEAVDPARAQERLGRPTELDRRYQRGPATQVQQEPWKGHR